MGKITFSGEKIQVGQRKPEAGAEQVGGGGRKSGIPAGKLEMEERGN